MTSKIKVDNINKVSDDSNIINKCGTTITLGASGDSIALASGASQTGFGRTGTVDWQTTPKTGDFTAVNGEGYFVNTTGGAVTVTLPASPSVGNIVAVADYAGTASSNNITVGRNGSNFEGGTADGGIATNRQTGTFVYADATQGWVAVNSNDASFLLPSYVTATGGTITTSGDYKIHTFTGPGTFCVSNAGNPIGSDTVDYLVVAGGGSGGGRYGGGGGGGGYRESPGTASGSYSVSPLGAAPAVALPVPATSYPITVGAGGAQTATDSTPSPTGNQPGNKGNNSVFSTITSTAGGAGASQGNEGPGPAYDGGSGGGAGHTGPAGVGNTPPVNPSQGTSGGTGVAASDYMAGGGGGATVAGTNAPPSGGGAGGDGATSSINGTPTTRAGGGGGGGSTYNSPGAGGAAGSGGAAAGGSSGGSRACAGTANTGGGGGGGFGAPGMGGAGGSGIVIIRYKFQ